MESLIPSLLHVTNSMNDGTLVSCVIESIDTKKCLVAVTGAYL